MHRAYHQATFQNPDPPSESSDLQALLIRTTCLASRPVLPPLRSPGDGADRPGPDKGPFRYEQSSDQVRGTTSRQTMKKNPSLGFRGPHLNGWNRVSVRRGGMAKVTDSDGQSCQRPAPTMRLGAADIRRQHRFQLVLIVVGGQPVSRQ